MDMKRDMEPDTVGCPHCNRNVDHYRYIEEWEETGCCNGNGSFRTANHSSFRSFCPKCGEEIPELENVAQIEDHFNKIGG
jgi:hypothetical protein